jgi:hypothetical protein
VITLDAKIDKLNIKFLYKGENHLADKSTTKSSIFEREFIFYFQHPQLYENYEALYRFHYIDAINEKLQPIKPSEISSYSVTHHIIELPSLITCKSFINMDRDGFYCEKCCSLLILKNNI